MNASSIQSLSVPFPSAFSATLKYTNNHNDHGWILVGLTNRLMNSVKEREWFCPDSSDSSTLGIASNQYVCEDGHWAKFLKAKFKSGDTITVTRSGGNVRFKINEFDLGFSKVMNGRVYMTVQLKKQGDRVELLESYGSERNDLDKESTGASNTPAVIAVPEGLPQSNPSPKLREPEASNITQSEPEEPKAPSPPAAEPPKPEPEKEETLPSKTHDHCIAKETPLNRGDKIQSENKQFTLQFHPPNLLLKNHETEIWSTSSKDRSARSAQLLPNGRLSLGQDKIGGRSGKRTAQELCLENNGDLVARSAKGELLQVFNRNCIAEDQEVNTNTKYYSLNMKYVLYMRVDGRLAMYRLTGKGEKALWMTDTQEKGNFAILESNGNFVIYNGVNHPENMKWATSRYKLDKKRQVQACVEDDGRFVIRYMDNQEVLVDVNSLFPSNPSRD